MLAFPPGVKCMEPGEFPSISRLYIFKVLITSDTCRCRLHTLVLPPCMQQKRRREELIVFFPYCSTAGLHTSFPSNMARGTDCLAFIFTLLSGLPALSGYFMDIQFFLSFFGLISALLHVLKHSEELVRDTKVYLWYSTKVLQAGLSRKQCSDTLLQ